MIEDALYAAGLIFIGVVIAAMRLRGPTERISSALLRVIPTLGRRPPPGE